MVESTPVDVQRRARALHAALCRALKLAQRRLDVLERQAGEPDEAIGMVAANASERVVDVAGHRDLLDAVPEVDVRRAQGEHAQVDALGIHIGKAGVNIEHVRARPGETVEPP